MDNTYSRRFAVVMGWVTLLSAVFGVVLSILMWSHLEAFVALTSDPLAAPYDLSHMSLSMRLIGGAVSLSGALIGAYGLLNLRRTFLEASAGRALSLLSVMCFRRFAWVSLILVMVGIVQSSLYGVIYSMSDVNSQNQVSVTFGSLEMGQLFSAVLLVFAAQVFAMGRQAEEDAAGII